MTDAFIESAGPAPARGDLGRWRQVALFGVAAATSGDDTARLGLAATLLALDCPVEAGRLLASVSGDDPWERWWTVLAVGQAGGPGLDAALSAARAEVSPRGAGGREVSRRLADLEAELSEIGGGPVGTARFTVLGHRARPVRRALIGGRSSAVYLVDPSWDALRLVRLAPSDGPSAGNAAHSEFQEVIDAVRRGDAGPGRRVPDDDPSHLEPGPMLEALREDPATRDGRLLKLAEEVREERERLSAERVRLAEDREELSRQRAQFKRRQAAAPTNGDANGRRPGATSALTPKSAAEAAALLGVDAGASRSTVQRHWRDQVAKCHPDRVEGLHPVLRAQAQEMAVALNAARDLLLGEPAPRTRRRGS